MGNVNEYQQRSYHNFYDGAKYKVEIKYVLKINILNLINK